MALESDQEQESLTEIKKIIENQDCPNEMHQVKSHVDILKNHLEFYWACKLLNSARDKQRTLRQQQESASAKEWWQEEAVQDEVWIVQKLALCTYKDEGLPPRKRLDQATILLEEIGLRSPENVNAETLSLGGAVYNRKWQKFGQLEDLHESLSFYRAAFERNRRQDMGYGGANAAFILDLLANRAHGIARRNGTSSDKAQHLQKQAKDLRQQMAVAFHMTSEKPF